MSDPLHFLIIVSKLLGSICINQFSQKPRMKSGTEANPTSFLLFNECGRSEIRSAVQSEGQRVVQNEKRALTLFQWGIKKPCVSTQDFESNFILINR